METIFDHDPTTDELRFFTGPYGSERYLPGLTQDQALEDLAGLFAIRGDGERSEAYARRISDQACVRFNILNHDFISDSAARNKSGRAESISKAA